MKIMNNFPRRARTVEGTFITLSDGTRLSAKIWLPDDAELNPVPAVLEYLPYRYQDGTARRDALTHPYFAGHGYAAVRVDMRGTGNSEGVLLDEYLKQEQDDALEVIDWIACQPWCSGSVGIIGISWGGFNGLQIAARRPQALKAVVSICSTDDRYADDIHYMGGAMLSDNIAWSTYMFSINTTPPDPHLHGDAWKDVWRQRVKESGLWLEGWLENQHRNDFYKHGSICENYDDVECPVYAVGGWADGYSNSVFRLLSNLKVPCKGLIGPWAHKYPHFAKPGPAIGFLQECLKWWDHWLKGIENGVMDDPQLRCWMQYPAPPLTRYPERPGRWVIEESWPSPSIGTKILHFGEHVLTTQEAPEALLMISSPQTTGLASGVWCPHGEDPDQPSDQRLEAGNSLNFDTGQLEADLEILGAPVAALSVSCDKPNGFVAACLSEVLPSGHATRITYGVLNLTHRDSHEFPMPLTPGRRYQVSLRLNEVAHRFGAGSRIRLSLSNAYWPTVWPSPEKTEIAVRTLGSHLELPVREPKETDRLLNPMPEPESAPLLRMTVNREGCNKFTVTRHIGTEDVVLRNWYDEGSTTFDDYDGWTVESTHEEFFTIHPDDPNSAKCDITWMEQFSRGKWNVSSRTNTTVTSTPTHFELEASLEAWNDGKIEHQQKWRRSIPRKLV